MLSTKGVKWGGTFLGVLVFSGCGLRLEYPIGQAPVTRVAMKAEVRSAAQITAPAAAATPIPAATSIPVPVTPRVGVPSQKSLPPQASPEQARGCHSQGDLICLALKYVAYQDGSGNLPQTEYDLGQQLGQVNRIWQDCGIQFQLDQFLSVLPVDHSLRYQTADYRELNEIRRLFMEDSTFLVVATGAWNRSGTLGNTWANAWTNLPGEGLYGAILERPVADDANLLAHELGHYLSLGHSKKGQDLMHPVVYRNSVLLTHAQCESARWAAKSFWANVMR
ncbi:hypothetical protein WDW37_21015 [Bdellovibrionota bacterium FG-1]